VIPITFCLLNSPYIKENVGGIAMKLKSDLVKREMIFLALLSYSAGFWALVILLIFQLLG